MTRCKFNVSKKTETATATGNEFIVELTAVTDGSEENQEFFKYTPSGKLKLGVLEPKQASNFVVGQEYYIDITPCESEDA